MQKTALLVVMILAIAACGSDSGSEVASLEDTSAVETEEPTSDELDADAEEAILAFSQCMRDNGVPEFPDPELDAEGNFRVFGGGGPGALGVDQETIQAAQEECFPLIEGILQNFVGQDVSELEDTFLEFAECMREQGIDMPDPDFSGGFGPGAGGRAGILGDIDPEDPEFQAAAQECQGIFEGRLGLGRPGPGN